MVASFCIYFGWHFNHFFFVAFRLLQGQANKMEAVYLSMTVTNTNHFSFEHTPLSG